MCSNVFLLSVKSGLLKNSHCKWLYLLVSSYEFDLQHFQCVLLHCEPPILYHNVSPYDVFAFLADFHNLAYIERYITRMWPIWCLCDLRKLLVVNLPATPVMKAYVQCEKSWRGPKGSCPQMMCEWQGLCQTGRQVALGSHSRTWVFEPCCRNPHVHTKTGHAYSKPAKS